MSKVKPIELHCQGICLSGLLAEAPAPRALILALHGGGMDASYFHGRSHRDLSLLETGAALGYSVLALDRPGYGASADLAYPQGRLTNQAELLFAALDRFAEQYDGGAGTFIVSHSYGTKVAIAMAGLERGSELLGIDASGTGLRYEESTLHLVADAEAPRPRGLERSLFWGPEWLYPEGTFAPGVRPIAEVPRIEQEESPLWTERLPGFAARVAVPIRISFADHERWWDVTPDALRQLKALFTQSPRVEIATQVLGGHNLSLGRCARAYHLKAIAFADECLLQRELALRSVDA